MPTSWMSSRNRILQSGHQPKVEEDGEEAEVVEEAEVEEEELVGHLSFIHQLF